VIDMTNYMMNNVNNLNVENERISYQLSTGKALENGSDDSVLYARILDIEDDMRVYGGLKTQIEKTTAQNNVSDSTMDEIKSSIDLIKLDLMKTLNSGMDESSILAVATNIEGLRENLITLVNTQSNGEYIFAGSDTTVQTFAKDDSFKLNGKVDFGGDAILRKVAVEPNTYRERGITALDIMMYNADTAGAGKELKFTEQERIIDENSKEWKITDTLTVGGTFEAGDKFNVTVAGATVSVDAITDNATTAKAIKDAINNNTTMSKTVIATLDASSNIIISAKTGGNTFITTVETTQSDETAADTQTFGIANHTKIRQFDKNGVLENPLVEMTVASDNKTPATYTTEAIASGSTRFLEAKHNFFDDLNIMINTIRGYSTNEDGTKGNELNSTARDTLLRSSLENTSNQYNASNIGHAELGGRNNIFNISLERINAKTVHFNILMQDVGSADMSKLAMESKSLEMTYQALYSTVSKMHSLSLLNYLK